MHQPKYNDTDVVALKATDTCPDRAENETFTALWSLAKAFIKRGWCILVEQEQGNE